MIDLVPGHGSDLSGNMVNRKGGIRRERESENAGAIVLANASATKNGTTRQKRITKRQGAQSE